MKRSRILVALALVAVALVATTTLVACDDDGGSGPGVTSSTERVEGILPLAPTSCLTQMLADADPSSPGVQYQCSALLDGDVLAMCGTNEPCWEILPVETGECRFMPSVRGGNDGQMLSIECLVEQ